jgi:hypothetical protein
VAEDKVVDGPVEVVKRIVEGVVVNLLTRKFILDQKELKRVLVEVPEWGGSVWVREMTGKERDEYEGGLMRIHRQGKKTQITPNFTNSKARMASMCVVDENGKQVFSASDVGRLGELSSKALNRIVDVAQELSGITEEDLEDLEKNSSKGPSADSTSD